MHKRTICMIVIGAATVTSLAAAASVIHAGNLQACLPNQFKKSLRLARNCPDTFLGELLYEKALSEATRIGFEEQQECLEDYGTFCIDAGKVDKGERLLRESRALALQHKPALLGRVSEKLVQLLERQQRTNEAEQLCLQTFDETNGANDCSVELQQVISFYRRHKKADIEQNFLEKIISLWSTPELRKQQSLIIWDLAELLIEKDKYEEAEKWIKQLKEPNHLALTYLAWCQAKQNRPKEAELSFKRALRYLKSHPSYPMDDSESEFQIRLLYAEFLDSVGRTREAKPHHNFCTRLAKIFPSEPSLNLIYSPSKPRLASRDNGKNESNFQPDSNTHPRNFVRGMRYLYGRVIDKEYGLKTNLEEAPENDKAWQRTLLCRYQLRQHKLKDAVAFIKEIMASAQSTMAMDDGTFYNVEHALLETHDTKGALELMRLDIEAYRRLLGNDECMSVLTLAETSEVFYFHKQYQIAINLMKEAQELHSKREKANITCSFSDSSALKLIASSYQKLGHHAEAKTAYEQLIAKDEWYSKQYSSFGDLTQDLHEYAVVCRMTGDSKKAEAALSKAAAIEAKYNKDPEKMKLSMNRIYDRKPRLISYEEEEF